MKKYLVIIFIFLYSCAFNVAWAMPDFAMPDSLVKASNSTIYYYAQNGKRYVFPNDKTYKTWFKDFSNVTIISDNELATMPLAGNVTYRPGVKLVKIQTDPKVYAVARGGILRWVKTEELATQLYGENWNQKIDDVPDAFFINYQVGEPITSLEDFIPANETLGTRTINENKGIEIGSAPLTSDTTTLAPIAITIINVTPNQILNSVPNYLTISGAKFLPGARVFLNSTEADEVNFINEETLRIKIIEGIKIGVYNIKVLNPNGTTATFINALQITSPVPEQGTGLSLNDIFSRVSPATVRIQANQGENCPCSGSGMVLDNEGYILTNYHVIEGNEEVSVRFYDDKSVKGEVLGWSELRDLALIKVSSSNSFVELGDYSAVKQGDVAFTLGYPLGSFTTNISEGIILAKSQIIKGSMYLLTDAEIEHGSSGGPLVDGSGKVIGVVRGGLVIPGTEIFYGYNFAIPIDIAQSLLPDLKAGIRTLKQ